MPFYTYDVKNKKLLKLVYDRKSHTHRTPGSRGPTQHIYYKPMANINSKMSVTNITHYRQTGNEFTCNSESSANNNVHAPTRIKVDWVPWTQEYRRRDKLTQ
uniref:Uncharacterized protein n=1 Tax=Cuerna arida TaxID=1464854 RepID=A0A1B6FVX3_9HEMI